MQLGEIDLLTPTTSTRSRASKQKPTSLSESKNAVHSKFWNPYVYNYTLQTALLCA